MYPQYNKLKKKKRLKKTHLQRKMEKSPPSWTEGLLGVEDGGHRMWEILKPWD
jgi:hypothetical protein